jgi:hypothetical protein
LQYSSVVMQLRHDGPAFKRQRSGRSVYDSAWVKPPSPPARSV